jgi:hypothetical protein
MKAPPLLVGMVVSTFISFIDFYLDRSVGTRAFARIITARTFILARLLVVSTTGPRSKLRLFLKRIVLTALLLFTIALNKHRPQLFQQTPNFLRGGSF